MRNVLNLATIKHTLAGSSILYRTTAVASMALAFAATDARANPTGAEVVSGNVSITNPTNKDLVVTSTTDRSIINWQNFDIMQGESTRFIQPGVNSVSLNRVVAGQNASQILGTLTSNGKIVLVNPNGVFFGAGSKVDVAGMIATTADISNANFLANKLVFDKAGRADASIVNNGTISATDGGLVALVAPGVENNGVIQANAGTIELASGSTIAVDMYGDNLYSFAVGKADAGAKGVSNTGVLTANAGTISLTANVAKNIVTNVVNNTGIIEASSATVKGGTVIIGGGDGDVNVAGTVNAKGATGGGNVKITGGNATVSAAIDVSATNVGNAGSAAILSDGLTNFDGSILAKGGVNGGNGGNVETSGQYLNLYGTVDASATAGVAGSWLLDPLNITISSGPNAFYNVSGTPSDATATPSFAFANVNNASLNAALNSGTNVTVTTQGTTGPLQGDITVLSAINWSSAASLTLDAVHDIFVGSSITSTYAGIGGNINLLAGNNIQIGTDGTNGTNGTNGLNGIGAIPGLNGINGTDGINGLNGSLTTAGGAITLTAANDITLGGKAGIAGNGGYGGKGGDTVDLGFITLKGGNGGKGGRGGDGGKAGKASITSGSGTITLDAGRDVTVGNTLAGAPGHNGIHGANGNGAKPGIGGDIGVGGVGGNPAGAVDITSTSGNININGTRDILFDHSTVNTAGKLTIDPANLNLAFGSSLTAGSHDITANNINIGAGSFINATTGNLDLHNSGIFTSADADSLNAANGRITLNQNAGGTIKNAIDAIGNYGTSAKVSLGNATFNEQVKIDGMNNFTLTSLDASNKATITAPDAMTTTFTTASGADIKAVVGVTNASNVTVSNLNIDGLSKNDTNNRETGVAFGNASGRISGNTITNMQGNPANGVQGGYGVYVYANNYGTEEPFRNVEVDHNDISQFQKNGIVANGNSLNANVHHNTITGLGAIDFIAQNGVVFQAGAEGSINSNNISNIGYTPDSNVAADILLFQAGDGVEVGFNKLDGAGYASGVIDYQSSAARIHNNTIKNTQNGIELDGANTSYVENNKINGTTNIGIWAYNSADAEDGITSGGAHITGNVVYNTGKDGIVLEDTNDSSVTGNYVGYKDTLGNVGANHNINGDGIVLDHSSFSIVNGNYVTETTSTEYNIGSGIHIINSGFDTVGGDNEGDANHITNVAWDDVKFDGSSNILVAHNDLSNAKRVGVFSGYSVDSVIRDNTIHHTLLDTSGAVQVDGGMNIDVTGNDISNAPNGAGIRYWHVSGDNLIDGNTVHNVGTNGIEVDGSSVVTASNNTITQADNNGIEVIDSDNFTASDNTIHNIGSNAIHIDPSNFATLTGNVVYNTGSDAIWVEDSDNATIHGNFVGYKDKFGTAGANNNINGDGILLTNADYASITGNYVTETTSTGFDIGSGIHIVKSYGDTVGGDNEGDANHVTKVEWDDVKIGDSVNILVAGNDLTDADRVGVFVGYSADVLVRDNTIHHTLLDTSGAVQVDGGMNIDVTGNDISNAPNGAGIRYWFVSGDNLIDGNTIHNVGTNGIEILGSGYGTPWGAGSTAVSNNTVSGADNDGIHFEQVSNASITGNTVHNVGNNGIYAYDLYRTENPESLLATHTNVSGNDVYNFDYDGIHLDTIENARVVNNTVHGGGHDGINTYNLYVNGLSALADTSDGSDEGSAVSLLKAFAEGDTPMHSIISDNDVYKVDHDGIHLVLTQNAKVKRNDVHNVGHDGIYANNFVETIELPPELPPIDFPSDEFAKVFIIEAPSHATGTGSYDNAVFAHNHVNNTGNDGIHLVSMNNALLSHNHVNHAGLNFTEEGDKGAAIEVEDSEYVDANNNRVKNSPFGFLFENSYNPNFNFNHVTGNGIGTELNGSNDGYIFGDIFTGNTLGINLDNSKNVTIDHAELNIPTFDEVQTVGLRLTNGSTGTLVYSSHFNGGNIGVLINGAGSSEEIPSEGFAKASFIGEDSDMQFGDNGSTFNNNQYYFVLENGAMFGKVLDASQQTFDDVRATDFTEDQLAEAEGKFLFGPHTVDVADDATLGDVFYKAFPAAPTVFDLSVLDDFQNNQRRQYRRGNFSYAGRALNLVADPIEPGSLDTGAMNLSLLNKASPTAAADIANVFATLAPAAGGNHKSNPTSPTELAALAPAAGGPSTGPIAGPSGNGGASFANSFLSDGYKNAQ